MRTGILFLTVSLVIGCAILKPPVSEIVLRSVQVPAMSESRQEEVLTMYSSFVSPPDREVFLKAVNGYDHISHKKGILTIIDFSMPSTEKRAWVVDMKKGHILFNTWVSHGVNSGENIAHTF